MPLNILFTCMKGCLTIYLQMINVNFGVGDNDEKRLKCSASKGFRFAKQCLA